MNQGGRKLRTWSVGALAGLALSACSLSDPPPLPGERIAVLVSDSAVEADPRIADLTVELPAPVRIESWPQQGGLAHHAMQHVSLGDVPQRVWEANAGAGSSSDAPILSGPVVADDLVYAMDAKAVVTAHAIDTGKRVWRTDVEPDDEDDGSWGGGVAHHDGQVFIASGFAQVIALNAATGEEVWRTRVSGPMRAAPTATGGRVFAVTKDNQMHALDATTGTVLWTHTGIAETAGLIGGASPAVEGDIVIAPYSSGELFALRVENGRQLWSDNLSAIRRSDAVSALADIRGRPVIADGRVFAASHSGRMVAIDLVSGRRVWEAEVGSVVQPWLAGQFLFVLSSTGEVVALTADTGLVRWVTPIGLFEDPEDRDDRIIWSSPLLAGDRLVVSGNTGELLSLSPYTGEVLGREKLPGGATVPAAAAQDGLFFLTDSAKLVALR